MIIRTTKLLTGNVYKVTIDAEEYSEGDLNLMRNYGEPEVDLGGDYTGPPTFTLANNLQRINSDSPFIQSFDADDEASPGDAELSADAWAVEFIVKLKASITTLRANTDAFTGESVETF